MVKRVLFFIALCLLLLISFFVEDLPFVKREIGKGNLYWSKNTVHVANGDYYFLDSSGARELFFEADLIKFQDYFIEFTVKPVKLNKAMDLVVDVYHHLGYDDPASETVVNIDWNKGEEKVIKKISIKDLQFHNPKIRFFPGNSGSFILKDVKLTQWNSFYYLIRYALPFIILISLVVTVFSSLRNIYNSLTPKQSLFFHLGVFTVIAGLFYFLPDVKILRDPVVKDPFGFSGNITRADNVTYKVTDEKGFKIINAKVFLKPVTDYYVSYEIQDVKGENLKLITDFYGGASYDSPDQEERTFIDSGTGSYRFSKIINSGHFNDATDISLRIFSDSQSTFAIKYIGIYSFNVWFNISLYLLATLLLLISILIIRNPIVQAFFSRIDLCREQLVEYTYLLGICFFLFIGSILLINTILLLGNFSVKGFSIPLAIAAVFLSVFVVLNRTMIKRLAIRKTFILFLIFIFILAVSALISGYFYDFTMDGLTYQGEGVYRFKNGWNPYYQGYPSDNAGFHTKWVFHYPNAAWIISAAFYDFFSHFDYGKIVNFMALSGAFFLVFALIIHLGAHILIGLFLSLVIIFNPVSISQLFTFYIDGNVLMMIIALIVLSYFSIVKPKPLLYVTMAMVIILGLNIKFTSTIYFILLPGLFFLYVFFTKRKNIQWLFLTTFFSFLIGILVVGYNPFINNTFDFGHPFHPLMGPSKIEILRAGQAIPDDYIGKDAGIKLFLSTFSKSSGHGPVYLKFPLQISANEFDVFKLPDPRVAGFGPLYAAILVLSVFCLGYWFFKREIFNVGLNITCLLLLAIVFSFAINPESWWVRYIPQMYLVPFIIMIPFLVRVKNNFAKIAFALFAILIFINSTYTLKFMLENKWTENQAFRKTLEEIRKDNKSINVCFYPYQGNKYRFEDEGIKFFEFKSKEELPCKGESLFFLQIAGCEHK